MKIASKGVIISDEFNELEIFLKEGRSTKKSRAKRQYVIRP